MIHYHSFQQIYRFRLITNLTLCPVVFTDWDTYRVHNRTLSSVGVMSLYLAVDLTCIVLDWRECGHDKYADQRSWFTTVPSSYHFSRTEHLRRLWERTPIVKCYFFIWIFLSQTKCALDKGLTAWSAKCKIWDILRIKFDCRRHFQQSPTSSISLQSYQWPWPESESHCLCESPAHSLDWGWDRECGSEASNRHDDFNNMHGKLQIQYTRHHVTTASVALLFFSFNTLFYWELSASQTHVSLCVSVRGQEEVGSESSDQITNVHRLYVYLSHFRLVPENLEVKGVFIRTKWIRGKKDQKPSVICWQLTSIFINVLSYVIFLPNRGTPFAKFTISPELAAALESEVWRVCVSQLGGQWLRGGLQTGVFPGGFATRPTLLPATQGRLPGRRNVHRTLPGGAGQPPLGSAYHARLPAGWLVPVYDAPGSGRGTHVQSDHPPVSEPVTGALSEGTQVLLLHQPESEPGERLRSHQHDGGHLWVQETMCHCHDI